MENRAGRKSMKENGRTHLHNSSNKLDLRNEIQEEFGSRSMPWFPWVFDAVDLPQGSRVLELGCGTGQLWQENQPQIKPTWTLLLSDQSAGMVKAARSNLAQVRATKHFMSMSSQSLPVKSESFDAVLAIGLLDLVPDLNQTLSEAWRVLRPSGQLIASAGGKGHLTEMEEMLKPFVNQEKAEAVGGQEDSFGMENGERLLTPYFEEVVRRDYQDRMVFHKAQPFLDYVFSEQSIVESMTLDKMDQFVESVRTTLARQGEIGVTVRKGVFVARKKVIGE